MSPKGDARATDLQASDVPPTPVPASAVKRRFALDDAPPELRGNFMVKHFASLTAEEQERLDAVTAARSEAAALYGEDGAAELAAIDAGTHPLQRLDRTAR
jgi:hypothetical protein